MEKRPAGAPSEAHMLHAPFPAHSSFSLEPIVSRSLPVFPSSQLLPARQSAQALLFARHRTACSSGLLLHGSAL